MAIYHRFTAWQRSHDLAVAVYRSTKSWPSEERSGLSSQARRAAHSAAANIAEGCAKKGTAVPPLPEHQLGVTFRAFLHAVAGERVRDRIGGGVAQTGPTASESWRHDLAALQVPTLEEG